MTCPEGMTEAVEGAGVMVVRGDQTRVSKSDGRGSILKGTKALAAERREVKATARGMLECIMAEDAQI